MSKFVIQTGKYYVAGVGSSGKPLLSEDQEDAIIWRSKRIAEKKAEGYDTGDSTFIVVCLEGPLEPEEIEERINRIEDILQFAPRLSLEPGKWMVFCHEAQVWEVFERDPDADHRGKSIFQSGDLVKAMEELEE